MWFLNSKKDEALKGIITDPQEDLSVGKKHLLFTIPSHKETKRNDQCTRELPELPPKIRTRGYVGKNLT